VCRTSTILQPRVYYLGGFTRLTSFISDFLKLLKLSGNFLFLMSDYSKVWSKKEKMNCDRVVALLMGYYILFGYVHVFYVLLFTRYRRVTNFWYCEWVRCHRNIYATIFFCKNPHIPLYSSKYKYNKDKHLKLYLFSLVE
jgi:hypothetical protein